MWLSFLFAVLLCDARSRQRSRVEGWWGVDDGAAIMQLRDISALRNTQRCTRKNTSSHDEILPLLVCHGLYHPFRHMVARPS